MNLLIVGASRGTGLHCVEEALARGHHVTALSRTGNTTTHQRLSVVCGDFHQSVPVAAHDAVIITAATTLRGFSEHPDFFSKGTRVVIDAMKQHGVKRLVVLSALGVAESRAVMNFMMRMMVVNGVLRAPFRDHEVQEQLTRESGLDWVIARPGRLTEGLAKHAYVQTTALEKVPTTISRRDVAHFLVGACERDDVVGKAFHLGG